MSQPTLSTGPRTEAGKAVSSQNAFAHGLTAARLVLPWENQREFDTLLHDLVKEHKPATATEGIMVREMAEQYWRLQRARNREHELLSQTNQITREAQRNPEAYFAWEKSLTLTQRYATRHERAFHKCLSTLRSLQKNRRQAEEEARKEAASTAAKPVATQFVSQNAMQPVSQTISQPVAPVQSPAAHQAA